MRKGEAWRVGWARVTAFIILAIIAWAKGTFLMPTSSAIVTLVLEPFSKIKTFTRITSQPTKHSSVHRMLPPL